MIYIIKSTNEKNQRIFDELNEDRLIIEYKELPNCKLKTKDIPIVLIDMDVIEYDSLSLVFDLKEKYHKLIIIGTTEIDSINFRKTAFDCGVDRVVLNPTVKSIEDAILNCISVNKIKSSNYSGLRRRIRKDLKRLGCKSTLNGNEYIVESILFLLKSNKYKVPITKEIYPYISKKYNIKINNVEHSIRTCICQIKNSNPSDFANYIFQDTDIAYISNSELIYTLADYYREEVIYND